MCDFAGLRPRISTGGWLRAKVGWACVDDLVVFDVTPNNLPPSPWMQSMQLAVPEDSSIRDQGRQEVIVPVIGEIRAYSKAENPVRTRIRSVVR